MDLERLIEEFGYAAIAVGTFFEGETPLVLGGFFASQDYLDLRTVLLVGFLGAFAGHIFWFTMGRLFGARLVSRFPSFEKKFNWFLRLTERYGTFSIFIAQFLYGFRITTALVFGVSRIPLPKFLACQAIATTVWVLIIGHLGYYFGHTVQHFMGRGVERYGVIIIISVAIAIFFIHRWRERRTPPTATLFPERD
jgi:membrane protein DedA with SNARE-associated domain